MVSWLSCVDCRVVGILMVRKKKKHIRRPPIPKCNTISATQEEEEKKCGGQVVSSLFWFVSHQQLLAEWSRLWSRAIHSAQGMHGRLPTKIAKGQNKDRDASGTRNDLDLQKQEIKEKHKVKGERRKLASTKRTNAMIKMVNRRRHSVSWSMKGSVVNRINIEKGSPSIARDWGEGQSQRRTQEVGKYQKDKCDDENG